MLRLLSPFFAAAMLACTAMPAHATYKIDFAEVGSDVIATGSGSLNVHDLSFVDFGLYSAIIFPTLGYASVGAFSTLHLNAYSGVTGPTNFGTGGAGLPFGPETTRLAGPAISGFDGRVLVQENYVSGTEFGTAISDFADASFATLGITPGIYVWTWGSGANADTFTIRIAAVPEPATWAMMIVGFGPVGAAMRCKRRQAGHPVSPELTKHGG